MEFNNYNLLSPVSFIGKPPTIYDAFVCYNEDSSQRERQFVKDCVEQLERKHELKLCIPERDCLIGGAKYICDAELIKSRYDKVCLDISPTLVYK